MNFLLKVLLYFLGCITFAAYASLFERKLIGRIQLRLGPDKCGIFGCFQPIADALKLFFKKDALKGHSKQAIYAICLMFAIALCQLTIIPISEDFCLIDSKFSLLFIIIFHSIFALCEIIIGILSKSKYGVIGGTRSYIQLLGSHIPFILILTCLALFTKSLSLNEIVKLQNTCINLIPQFPLFIIFFINMLIFSNKSPFDFIEAESEIVSGTYIEYGGILFAIIYLSDYLNLIFASGLIATLFLGGYNSIFGINLLPYINIILKTIFIIGTIILIRAILPRYKQEQMIYISWMVLSIITIIYLFFLI